MARSLDAPLKIGADEPAAASPPARQEMSRQVDRSGSERVPPGELDDYINDASANFAAERSMLTYLDAQPVLKDVEYSREVRCRGWLCKTQLKFKTWRDATRLLRMERPADVDISYSARAVDLQDTSVTIFSALRGATLTDVIASAKAHDGVYSEQAALARAAEIEERADTFTPRE